MEYRARIRYPKHGDAYAWVGVEAATGLEAAKHIYPTAHLYDPTAPGEKLEGVTIEVTPADRVAVETFGIEYQLTPVEPEEGFDGACVVAYRVIPDGDRGA